MNIFNNFKKNMKNKYYGEFTDTCPNWQGIKNLLFSKFSIMLSHKLITLSHSSLVEQHLTRVFTKNHAACVRHISLPRCGSRRAEPRVQTL